MRKPHALLLAAVFAASLASHPARAAVILSELCDPQLNYTTDRFIEIYNTGPDAVDLADWSVVAVANNLAVTTWDLSGILAAGQAKVAGGPTTVTGFTVHFQSAVWATTAGYMNWNGKVGDGARLVNADGITVDAVVAPGTLFENADLVRNPEVSVPSPVYVASEWTATPVELATDASPGTHNGSAPPPGGPSITGIVTVPMAPAAGTPVDVQASVVDTTGPVAGVDLSWGTSSGSLPNVIAMALLAGSTYQTVAPIPGYPGGATIYYRIEAEGASETSRSAILSYTVPGGGGTPPSVLAVGEMSDSTLLVTFSEPVEEASAEVASHYTVGALTGVAAVRDPVRTAEVLVTLHGIPAGARTLTVSGVADLEGSTAVGATRSFNWVDVSIPAGYYDGTIGLSGSALRVALHNLIKNHTVRSYDYAYTAFQTADVKPNGKVWDMYSDVPGGTPPYEYAFGETGQGADEGMGYNREHSWPQSWFDGASPMYSDLWILYPTDSKVNGYRANYPLGEVGVPTITSLNGSKVGANVSPGYSGTVFEPIDAYKGDLARSQFYVATRYFGQDAAWPGSPSADGAELLPWAAELYLQWSANDPVSWKERLRNGAIWLIQNRRNPFIDHPEFVTLIWDSSSVAGVETEPARALRLWNAPNPFDAGTTIGFDLARRERVTLSVYDVTGRRVTLLADGWLEAGTHRVAWSGQDDAGARLRNGLYFCRIETAAARATRRMVLAR